MALFLQQKDGRSELQERVAAELQAKLQKKIETNPVETQPAMLEDQNKTRTAGVVIIVLLLVLVVGIAIWVSGLNR